jgi:multicomponent Na+:H+ antiporter subunit A
MGLLSAILTGFGAACVAPALCRIRPTGGSRILALLPVALMFYFSGLIDDVAAGGPVHVRYDWIPSLGIHLSLHADALALLFCMLISLIGACVFLYASGYLAGDRDIGRFYFWIMIFMAAMLGVVLSANLITLFVFWELTSISSYMLIGYYHEQASARAAALQALLVTGAGGLALMAGFILLGTAGGSFEIADLLGQGNAIRDHPLYIPILILVLLGAFTKSAQFPFHFWLPNAMAGPAPVSAYLHSATMVKAGIYLMARLAPILGQTAIWEITLTVVGAGTMVWSAILAARQTDMKRVLAYSTITILGALTLLIGAGTALSVKAAVILLLAHSLYKGALFMVAGIVDHETGERDVTRLGGLYRVLPVTACAAAVAAFSNAGMPPMLGFIAKEYFYKAKLDLGDFAVVLTGAALAANVMLVVVALLVGFAPFYGQARETPKPAHEAPWPMLVGPVLLAGLGLLFGTIPTDLDTVLIQPAVRTITGDPSITITLGLWHDLIRNPTAALALSAATIVLGVVVYRSVGRIRTVRLPAAVGLERVYEGAVAGMLAVAQWQTRILQNGYLRSYVLTILTVTIGLVGWRLLGVRIDVPFASLQGVQFYQAAVCVLIAAGALFAVWAPTRLSAIASLGVVGLGMTMVFFLNGAPDLALTQIFVETLTVILFVLAFYRLPQLHVYSSLPVRARDAAVATAAGCMMTSLVLLARHGRFQNPISSYFAEHSYTLARGRNVVNVILVDFRGLDTFGEIIVLSVAALGVLAMIKLRIGQRARRAAAWERQ